MQLRAYAVSRLRAAREEATSLLDGDFPYDDPKFLIYQIRERLSQHIADLEHPALAPDVAQALAQSHLSEIGECLTLLGFALRATNLRNAFEVYGPLLRLASRLLQLNKAQGARTTKLLIGSEWEYSPFLIPEPASYPGYVLLGIPAPESGNPLLIPMAGHEFGHAIWRSKPNPRARMTKAATEKLAVQVRNNWSSWIQAVGQHGYPQPRPTSAVLRTLPSYLYHSDAMLKNLNRQVEETFCDLLALRIFGMSYIHSFAYLVYPGTKYTPCHYPSVQTRLTNLLYASQKLNIDVKDVDPGAFKQAVYPRGPLYPQLFSTLVSETLSVLLDKIIVEIKVIATQCDLEMPKKDDAKVAARRLMKCVPLEGDVSIATIINAAWRISDSPSRMKHFEGPNDPDKKISILKDLVLKSLEIQEMNSIRAER